jgi:hypothetical protein
MLLFSAVALVRCVVRIMWSLLLGRNGPYLEKEG